MELLLEVQLPAGGRRSAVDVAVQLDSDATVAQLCDAVVRYAHRCRLLATRPPAVRLRRGDDSTLLPADAAVSSTELVSGDTICLVPVADTGTMPPSLAGAVPSPGQEGRGSSGSGPVGRGGLALDLVAGPQAGRIVPLPVGPSRVGRSQACEVAVADPALSREHLVLQVTAAGTVQLEPNLEARNGTLLDGRQVDGPVPLAPGQLVRVGATVLAVRHAVPEDTRRRDLLGQVPLNRVPYRRVVVRPRELEPVGSPPNVPQHRKISLLVAMSPMVMGIVMYLAFGRWYFLIMTCMSPVLLVLRAVGNRRGGKKKYAQDRDAFFRRVEQRVDEVDAALGEERRERLLAAPDLADLARQALFHMPRLWERNRTAGDLLRLRLGLGEAEAGVESPVSHGGDDELRDRAVERLAFHSTVRDVPVTVDLTTHGVMGLYGDADAVAACGRGLVAQASCLHSPEDVVVAAALGGDGACGPEGFDWLKWLPHTRSATTPLAGSHVAVGPDAAHDLLVRVMGIVAGRAAQADARRGSDGTPWPKLLLLLDEGAEFDRALLARVLDSAPAAGICPLWLGRSRLDLPRQCRATLACPTVGAGGQAAGRLRFTDPDLADRQVELDRMTSADAALVARALAPLRDASASSQTTAIPRVVPLLDVLDLDEPSPEAVARRWQAPRPYGLTFPLGMSADGVMQLDLVEQGPHTLIGGTSGAGKSELLQSMVLSLASSYSPRDLNFLFVDYKGGASSAELCELPHAVGYVTNLSGRMSLRALTSLRAELRRRMLLMEGRAKDVAEMRQVAPEDAPPSLVILVDEFAALVKEVPDFMAGIVDIAQRGRSLGIHLVLATQRPTGVVNDNILANTNLRMSLRVLDPADSSNIIGSRDAADIPVPLKGRGYARTGPAALMPFQCAWAGAPLTAAVTEPTAVVRPFALRPEDEPLALMALTDADSAPTGERAGSPTADGTGVAAEDSPGGEVHSGEVRSGEPPTHLEVLLAACAGAARKLDLPAPRRPWMEPLAEVIPQAAMPRQNGTGASGLAAAGTETPGTAPDPGRTVTLGLCDDPANQAQQLATVDLESSGGLVVFGTGGSGKTTLLRTAALDLARQGSPASVQLEVLDYASRGLDSLAALPHCGQVIPGDDMERTARLLTALTAEMARRREQLAAASAEDLGALRRTEGAEVLPRIVLLVDGYPNFQSSFEKNPNHVWVERFQTLASGGRQVGIHVVLTADRRQGVASSLLSSMAARVVLRMATPEEMATLGVPSKVAKDAELPNGRGFLDGSTELQVACVSEEPNGTAQVAAVRAAADQFARRYGSVTPASALPELPELAHLPAVIQPPNGDQSPNDGSGGSGEQAPPNSRLTASLAVADLTLEPVSVDLTRQNFVVAGPPLSGKSMTLATLAEGLRRTRPDLPLVAVGGSGSPLAGLDLWDDAAFARGQHGDVLAHLARLAEGEGVEPRAVLLVDAAEDIDDRPVVKALEALAPLAGLRLAVAAEPHTVSKAHSGWLSALRRNRSALLLQPESASVAELVVGVKPALRPGQQFPPGRGVLSAQRRWSLVQVAQPTPPAA